MTAEKPRVMLLVFNNNIEKCSGNFNIISRASTLGDKTISFK